MKISITFTDLQGCLDRMHISSILSLQPHVVAVPNYRIQFVDHCVLLCVFSRRHCTVCCESVPDTALSDKVYQWLLTGQWFPPGTFSYIVAVSFIDHWHTLSHNVVSNTLRLNRILTHNVSGDRHGFA